MNTSKLSTLVTIAKIIQAHSGNWSYASQQKILDLLKQYHGIKINIRALNYHLADLRNLGLIKTWRRHKRESNGTCILRTSGNCLTIKGCMLLCSMGVTWASKQLRYLKHKYVPAEVQVPKTINTPMIEDTHNQGGVSQAFIERCQKKGISMLEVATATT